MATLSSAPSWTRRTAVAKTRSVLAHLDRAIIDPAGRPLQYAAVEILQVEEACRFERQHVMFAGVAMRDESLRRPNPGSLSRALVPEILPQEAPPHSGPVKRMRETPCVVSCAKRPTGVDVAFRATPWQPCPRLEFGCPEPGICLSDLERQDVGCRGAFDEHARRPRQRAARAYIGFEPVRTAFPQVLKPHAGLPGIGLRGPRDGAAADDRWRCQ